MFGGEDVQVRICKINQKTKLKLICPIKSEDQPLDLWMRTTELKMANILETEETLNTIKLASVRRVDKRPHYIAFKNFVICVSLKNKTITSSHHPPGRIH